MWEFPVIVSSWARVNNLDVKLSLGEFVFARIWMRISRLLEYVGVCRELVGIQLASVLLMMKRDDENVEVDGNEKTDGSTFWRSIGLGRVMFAALCRNAMYSDRLGRGAVCEDGDERRAASLLHLSSCVHISRYVRTGLVSCVLHTSHATVSGRLPVAA